MDARQEVKSKIVSDDENYFVRPFFRKILAQCTTNISAENKNSSIKFITVNHIVPTLVFYLDALEKLGTIAAIIPKGSEEKNNKSEVMAYVRNKYTDKVVRSDIKKGYLIDHPEYAVNLVKEITENTKSKVIIIDIGGYFSPCLEKLSRECSDIFLGIVEVTENGEQRYIKAMKAESIKKTTPIRSEEAIELKPIISIARSPIKESEDVYVGLSIVRATDTILRTDAHTILERISTIGVIGFGKIGRSVVQSLKNMGISDIRVCEMDSNRAREAANRPFSIDNVVLIDGIDKKKFHKFLSDCRLIFCATGRKCLQNDDYKYLSNNVFISSCTSAEDEFDREWLKENSKKQIAGKTSSIAVYSLQSGNNINFLVDGNAVNFAFDAVDGVSIYGVQASTLFGASQIIKFDESKTELKKREITRNRTLYELSNGSMEELSAQWLHHFNSKYFRDYLSQHAKRAQLWGLIDDYKVPTLYHKKLHAKINENIQRYFKSSINNTTLVMVLHGTYGVGKSTLVKTLLVSKDNWPRSRYFFHADSVTCLNIEYRRIAKKLIFKGSSLMSLPITEAVKNHLEDNPGWIIVYDNVNDWKKIKDFIPKKGGVVIATCNNEWTNHNIDIDEEYELFNLGLIPEDELEPSRNNSITCVAEKSENDKIVYRPLTISLLMRYFEVSGQNEESGDVRCYTNGESALSFVFTKIINFLNEKYSHKLENLYLCLFYFATTFPDHIPAGFFEDRKECKDILTMLEDLSVIKKEGKFFHINANIQPIIKSTVECKYNNGTLDFVKDILAFYKKVITQPKMGSSKIEPDINEKLQDDDHFQPILEVRHLDRLLCNAYYKNTCKQILTFMVEQEDHFKMLSAWDIYLNVVSHLKITQIELDIKEYFLLKLTELLACTIYFYKEDYDMFHEEIKSIIHHIDVNNLQEKYRNMSQVDLNAIKLLQAMAEYLQSAFFRQKEGFDASERHIKSAEAIIGRDFNEMNIPPSKFDVGINLETLFNIIKSKVHYNHAGLLIKKLKKRTLTQDEVSTLTDQALSQINTSLEYAKHANHQRSIYLSHLKHVELLLAKKDISKAESKLNEIHNNGLIFTHDQRENMHFKLLQAEIEFSNFKNAAYYKDNRLKSKFHFEKAFGCLNEALVIAQYLCLNNKIENILKRIKELKRLNSFYNNEVTLFYTDNLSKGNKSLQALSLAGFSAK
jgi:adenosylhomocysteinase